MIKKEVALIKSAIQLNTNSISSLAIKCHVQPRGDVTVHCGTLHLSLFQISPKLCKCYILFSEVSTTPLYKVTMMFYVGVFTTSPYQNINMFRRGFS